MWKIFVFEYFFCQKFFPQQFKILLIFKFSENDGLQYNTFYLHCWTKATKQSKNLLFSRNFFEQSEKANDMINQKILEKHKKNVYSATLLSNY